MLGSLSQPPASTTVAGDAPGQQQQNPLGAMMAQFMSSMNQGRTAQTGVDPRSHQNPVDIRPSAGPTPASQTNSTVDVPPQLLPVIARDVQKQSQQPRQTPFSDAYLEGQPLSKRRKTEFNSVSLEKRLEKSITKTPGTNATEAPVIAAHAAKSLSTLYLQQVKSDMDQSAAANPNYSSLRFPNLAHLCSTVTPPPNCSTTEMDPKPHQQPEPSKNPHDDLD